MQWAPARRAHCLVRLQEDNLRDAERSLRREPLAGGSRARLLHPNWKARGAYGEERQRLTALLERADVADQPRAELFGLLSEIEVLVGDLDAAEAAARQSLLLAEPGADVRVYAFLDLA